MKQNKLGQQNSTANNVSAQSPLSEEDLDQVQLFVLGEEYSAHGFDREQFANRMLADTELAFAVADEVARLQTLNAVVAREFSSLATCGRPSDLQDVSSKPFSSRTIWGLALAASMLLAAGVAVWRVSAKSELAKATGASAEIESVADHWAMLQDEDVVEEPLGSSIEADALGELIVDFGEHDTEYVEDFSSDWMSLVAENYFES